MYPVKEKTINRLKSYIEFLDKIANDMAKNNAKKMNFYATYENKELIINLTTKEIQFYDYNVNKSPMYTKSIESSNTLYSILGIIDLFQDVLKGEKESWEYPYKEEQ